MSLRSQLAAAALVLVSATAASAQSIPSPYRFVETRQEVTAFGGWMIPGTGQFGYGPGPGPQIGARYAVDLGGAMSAEAGVGWIPTTRDVIDPRRRAGDRKIGVSNVDLLTVDARLKLSVTGPRTWHGLNPIAFFGAGAAWDLAPESADDRDLLEADRFVFKTSFLGELGVGLRWFVTDRVDVRGETGLYLWRLTTPEGFQRVDRGFGDVGSSEWANAANFQLGLGWRF